MKVVDVHHVSLVVADTGRALRFYREVLGLVPDPARPRLGFGGAWLHLGERGLHLLELPSPDPAEGRPAHGGRDRHTAVLVDDLDAFVERLDRHGVGYTTSRSGRRALFCRDPDGNAWELIESN